MGTRFGLASIRVDYFLADLVIVRVTYEHYRLSIQSLLNSGDDKMEGGDHIPFQD